MARLEINSGVYLGYDGVADAFRTSQDQKYDLMIAKPSRWGTLAQESLESARRIRDSTDKEIVVLYSGGLDSEWVLESFRLARIPVTALCVVYKNGLNSHDMWWARRYLARVPSVKQEFYELDLLEWYKSQEQKDLAFTVQTPELAYTAQFKAILDKKNSDRVFITSYDEPLLVANDSGDTRKWELTYSERHYSVVKLFNYFNIDGCSNWSRQSAKLFASFITQPQWNMLAANMYAPLTWNSEMVKIPMFQYSFPYLEARPKFTGFEQSLDFIVDIGNEWRKHLLEEHGVTWMQDYTAPIEEVCERIGVTRRDHSTY